MNYFDITTRFGIAKISSLPKPVVNLIKALPVMVNYDSRVVSSVTRWKKYFVNIWPFRKKEN